MNASDINTPMNAGLLQSLPSHRRTIFAARLAKHWPRLQSLFSQLYPNPDDSRYLQRLSEIMVQRLQQRSDELFALDEAREARPDWFTDSKQMGYMAYTDRMAGTLKGIENRIPHLQSLGITYLHLLPFLKARNGDNDGGFAVSSFNDVNPQLGTREDLAALTARLREAGISLCSDIVLNHIADDHDWVRKAIDGDAHYRRYFHIFENRCDVDAYEATLNQVFPETAPGNFTWNESLQAWVWTTFYPYQWDLNYSNPAVLLDMVDAMLDLANLGIEAFRLDSAGYLWKVRGTACMNLPQTHLILQLMRACIDMAAPAVLLKAEAIVPTRELPPYFGVSKATPGNEVKIYTSEPQTTPSECHLAYHSSLMTAIWLAISEQRSDVLQRVIAGTPTLPDNCSWITYIRCHDDIGWNVLRPELEEAGDVSFDRLKAASRFMSGQTENSFASGQAFQAAGTDRVHGSNGMTASLLGLEKSDPRDTLARLNLVFGLITCIGGLPLIYMGDEFAQGNATDLTEGAWAAEDGRRLQRPFWDAALEKSSDRSLHKRQWAQLKSWQSLRSNHAELGASQSLELVDCGHPCIIAFRRGGRIAVCANLSAQTIALNPAQTEQLKLANGKLAPWEIRVEITS